MGIGSSFWLHLPCKQLTRGPVALPGARGLGPCWCQLWAVLRCSALFPGTEKGDPWASGCWHQPVWCTMEHVHRMAVRPPPHPVGQEATHGMLCRMEPSFREHPVALSSFQPALGVGCRCPSLPLHLPVPCPQCTARAAAALFLHRPTPGPALEPPQPPAQCSCHPADE